jgi:hypothetical protein
MPRHTPPKPSEIPSDISEVLDRFSGTRKGNVKNLSREEEAEVKKKAETPKNFSQQKRGCEYAKLLTEVFYRRWEQGVAIRPDGTSPHAGMEWMSWKEIEEDLTKKTHSRISRATIIRHLNELVQGAIVEKAMGSTLQGQYPRLVATRSYYRLMVHLPEVSRLQTLDRDDLLTEAIRYYLAFRKCAHRYLDASTVYCNGNDEIFAEKVSVEIEKRWEEDENFKIRYKERMDKLLANLNE